MHDVLESRLAGLKKAPPHPPQLQTQCLYNTFWKVSQGSVRGGTTLLLAIGRLKKAVKEACSRSCFVDLLLPFFCFSLPSIDGSSSSLTCVSLFRVSLFPSSLPLFALQVLSHLLPSSPHFPSELCLLLLSSWINCFCRSVILHSLFAFFVASFRPLRSFIGSVSTSFR